MVLQHERGYADLVAAWKALRATHALSIREVACVNAPRTLLLVEIGSHRERIVTLTAGMHGDEPAGMWALLSLAADRLLDDRFGYRIWACVNPSGYTAGTRENAEGNDINRSFSRGGTTPESKALVTSNRDRRFLLNIDLHEDFEADGFYAYEVLRPDARPRYGTRVITALADAGFPVQALDRDFDLGPPLAQAAQTLEHGVVLVDARAEERAFPGGVPLSLYLVRRASDHSLTFETPRRREWNERIAMHRLAVTTALSAAG